MLAIFRCRIFCLLVCYPKNIKIKIYRTIIFPVVLYGCETWPVTLREERRLRVLENRVLRKIFGPKRDEVRGKWRKLQKEKLNELYSAPNIVRVIKSRRMRWVGHVARMGRGEVYTGFFVGKPEVKKPAGRPRSRWEDNIKVDLQEVGCGGMDWMDLAQNRDGWRSLVNAVMKVRVSWNAGNFLTSWEPISFSGSTLLHGLSEWVNNCYSYIITNI